jgi:nucleoside-diphosphate-sugar epimerase
MLYPDGGDHWIDEDTAPDHFPLTKANLAAEANIQRFSEHGGTGVVLRFGWFYGPGATHSEQFFALARRHVCVQMGRPETYVSSIHMADAGTAVEAALRVAAGTYNVVDDEPLTKRAYGDALAAAADARPWLRYPGTSALLLGDRTTSLTRSIRASNRRFKDAAGWTPAYPSAREGWSATADALATH